MIRFFSVCIFLLLGTFNLEVKAAVTAPSVDSQSTSIPTGVRFVQTYFYPSYFFCDSPFSGTEDIIFSVRELNAAGTEVNTVWLTSTGTHMYYVNDPEVGLYEMCFAQVTYDTLSPHGTAHILIDPYGLWDLNWVFVNAYPF